MEEYICDIELVRSLLNRFHNIVDLNISELRIVPIYLFSKHSVIPDSINVEYKGTLIYLKDIVLGNEIKGIKELVSYYETLAADAENALNETIRDEKDDDPMNGENTWFSIYENSKESEINDIGKFNCGGSCINSFNRLFLRSEDNFKWCSPISGSFRMITTIRAYHFVGFETCHNVYIRNKEEHNGIQLTSIDQLLLSHDHHGHCSNGKIDVFASRFEQHYDLLIKRLSKEEPIFNKEFKIHLTQWLLSFKLKNPNLEQRFLSMYGTICYDRTSSNLQDAIYDRFQKLAQNFYEYQLSSKDWIILKAPDGHSWLTTDDPGFSIDLSAFISLNESLQPDSSLINLQGTSVIYFQLTKNYCLRIQPKAEFDTIKKHGTDWPIIFKQSSEIEFKTINLMTVSTSKSVLISADKQTLEQFV